MRTTFFVSQLPQHTPAPSFKVVVLGHGSVGKTSLINRYCLETFNNTYQPSIGYPYQSSVTTVGEQQVTLRLWEVNADRPNQYGNAQRFALAGAATYIVLFDLTSDTSFHAAEEHVKMLQATFTVSGEQGNIILAGTKSDLLNMRVVSDKQAQAFASQVGCLYFATSSKNNTNVDALFNHIAQLQLAKFVADQENDWVLVNKAVGSTATLSMILSDEIWVKSEGILSKLKAGLKEMIASLNDHSKEYEHEYLEDIKKIAMTYSKEKSSLLFFLNDNKDTPLKAAYRAISTASSLSDAESSVLIIKDQLRSAIGCNRSPQLALTE